MFQLAVLVAESVLKRDGIVVSLSACGEALEQDLVCSLEWVPRHRCQSPA